MKKKRVKTNVIAICTIGILVGVTVAAVSVYFGLASCASNPTPNPIPPDA
jgi:hypothetical protein